MYFPKTGIVLEFTSSFLNISRAGLNIPLVIELYVPFALTMLDSELSGAELVPVELCPSR